MNCCSGAGRSGNRQSECRSAAGAVGKRGDDAFRKRLLVAAAVIVVLIGFAMTGTSSASQIAANERQTGNTKTFYNVTGDIWSCVKSRSRDEHGTTYEPAGSHQGRATTTKWVGTISLDFSFDLKAKKITYSIVEKPMVVWTSSIWDGIKETIERCGEASV